MPLVLRMEPGSEIYTEQQVFRAGDDGTRQLTTDEAAKLERYRANGGPHKFEIEEAKPKKGGK